VARVNPALCKGCGICVADCPTGAMAMKGYSTLIIDVQMEALLQEAFS
jgi:heterodisulfide reductase subunit A